jgi:glycosyltransferase involved in cell wall biosynthesis
VPEPRISALLCSFNRRHFLKRALESLEAQTVGMRNFEVVVVDDGSTDGTSELEAEFRGRLQLRWARQENMGLAAAKNLAIRQARAPILAFLDDDDIASPSLLEEHLRAHAKHPMEEVAVLGFTDLSPEVAEQPIMHFVTEVGFYLFCYPKMRDGEMLDHTYLWGGRSSCKAALLHGIEGPFDPDFRFGCEDIELGHRLRTRGLRVLYRKAARSTMIRAMTLDDVCRRAERQGESNWVFLTKHPCDAVRQWAQLEQLEASWRSIEGRMHLMMASARGLDTIVRARRRHSVPVEPQLMAMLHESYWAVIDAHRIRGSWRSMQSAPSNACSAGSA